MAPPNFGDLGKAARDIFSKGYHIGVIMLELRAKVEDSIDTAASISLYDTSRTCGYLETKYKANEHGLVFTERWNTNNSLSTEISLENKIAEGLKMAFDTTFSPSLGEKNARVKCQYKLDKLALALDGDLHSAGPNLNACAVVGHKGWFFGWQTGFDCASSMVTKNNMAMNFCANDFEVYLNMNPNWEYCASVYQKLTPQLETAIQLSSSADPNNTKFEIGSKYDIDETTSLRAKVDNSTNVGLSMQYKLGEGVSMTMSLLIDVKNFNEGVHRVGLALDLKK